MFDLKRRPVVTTLIKTIIEVPDRVKYEFAVSEIDISQGHSGVSYPHLRLDALPFSELYRQLQLRGRRRKRVVDTAGQRRPEHRRS